MKKTQALINELLVDVFNHILSIEEAELIKAGIKLSINEVHILEAVKNAEYPTMTNIAKKLRITTGTLTTSIDRLVQKKYVVRDNDENDRRKVLIRLTPNALEVLKAHEKFHSKMIEALLEDMKIDEDEVLIKSLESIAEFFRSKY
ncbi:MAG TPA: MarR family transcriptional regulator [Bacilli bacterium]|jgi:DNA-binding MarR family transcriptional regulator|nr:MarR family transcriptional regulator [Acholeplasmataceae bacterium]OQB61076.1 MAG: Multiple antibiotic resistance protein MarR [Tenericutes bacterium ADurb.Bin140]HOE77630.1 MarR family transcriptional regulator [Bacilli bacterium]HON64426.1 MarR family transcriptional regulator [Bacilli bacterium]HOR96608.1 MarR family transcriptional regulator [Bacilli bacterium]